MRIELLDPKNDYVFKRIFGHIGNENITKQMLSAILKTKVNTINLEENTILEQDIADDKIGIIDIHAKINEKTDVDIEMQLVNQKNIEKRLLFYWSKLYTKNIQKGQNYNELNKTIVVLIADFEIEKLKEIPDFYTKWQIREENHTTVILTEVLEFYIIETTKIKGRKQEGTSEIKPWLLFLENPEKMEMENMSEENKEAIKGAKKVLEEISADEYERRIADLRQKHILDQKAIEEYGYDHGVEDGIKQGREQGIKQGIEQGIKQGIEQGVEQGREQGIKQGIIQEKKQIAKEMLKQKCNIELIVSVTGLDETEIEKLK